MEYMIIGVFHVSRKYVFGITASLGTIVFIIVHSLFVLLPFTQKHNCRYKKQDHHQT